MNKIYKHLILLMFTLSMLVGCIDGVVDVQPKIGTVVIDTKVYRVFDGTVGGVSKPFWYNIKGYECNTADNFVYAQTGGALYLDNGLSVVCTTFQYDKTVAIQSGSTPADSEIIGIP